MLPARSALLCCGPSDLCLCPPMRVHLRMLSYDGCRVPSSAQSAIHKGFYPMLFEAGQNLLENNNTLLLQLRIARRQS